MVNGTKLALPVRPERALRQALLSVRAYVWVDAVHTDRASPATTKALPIGRQVSKGGQPAIL